MKGFNNTLMKLKTILIVSASFLTLQSIGQPAETIKDYFIPVDGKNQTTYFQKNEYGAKTAFQRTILYVNRNGNYDVLISSYYKLETSTFQSMTISLSNTDARMISSVYITSGENGTKVEKTYNPASIVLKMPSPGLTEKWDFTNISGEDKICTSSWTDIIFEGEHRPAIKLVMTSKGYVSSQINYYAKAIGLWKIQFRDAKGEIYTFCEFDKIDYYSEGEK